MELTCCLSDHTFLSLAARINASEHRCRVIGCWAFLGLSGMCWAFSRAVVRNSVADNCSVPLSIGQLCWVNFSSWREYTSCYQIEWLCVFYSCRSTDCSLICRYRLGVAATAIQLIVILSGSYHFYNTSALLASFFADWFMAFPIRLLALGPHAQ